MSRGKGYLFNVERTLSADARWFFLSVSEDFLSKGRLIVLSFLGLVHF